MEKKIAIILAFRDFKDEEYFIPKQIFEEKGFKVITSGASEGLAIGVSGGEAKVDVLTKDLNVKEFEAIVFIGGPGALKYLDNDISYRIIKEAKVLGAICIAPVILAKAGILKGKKAAVWNSPLDKSGVKIFKEQGAIFLDQGVVEDGSIITAKGPSFAEQFSHAILKKI